MITATEEGATARPLAPSTLDTVALVVNEAAGAASLLDAQTVVQRVAEALPETTITTVVAAPDALEAEFDAMFVAAHRAVIVLGGDGTARAAAKRAMATGIPIALLPGGTMNVLSKLVFGHADLEQAIEDLRTARITALDAGMAGNEPFFLSAAFGFAGPLAKLRETLRPPRRARSIASATLACARGLGPSLRGGVGWRAPGERWQRANTLVVALGSLDRILSPEEQEIETDARLQAAALRLRSGWDIARLGSDAVRLRDWRRLNQIKVRLEQRFELDIPSKRPLAVLDGEPMRLSRLTEITVAPRALPVLAPRHRAG
jgi:diacylglycerol kinase family enzyme